MLLNVVEDRLMVVEDGLIVVEYGFLCVPCGLCVGVASQGLYRLNGSTEGHNLSRIAGKDSAEAEWVGHKNTLTDTKGFRGDTLPVGRQAPSSVWQVARGYGAI